MRAAVARDLSTHDVLLSHGITTIGRARSNKIVIPIATTSYYHAKIVTFNKTAYIQDLGSTNGTYVNGKRTFCHILHESDCIQLGEYRFTIAGFE